MFSTKLTRAAHRATTSSTAAISNHTSTTCISCLTTQRPNHQRRQSSSKTSCPPDNTSSKPAPTAKASASEESEKVQASSLEQQPSQSRSGKGRSRGGYKKVGQVDNASKKAVPAEPIDQFAGLPSVPSIQNVDARELTLSSFFSLHRPISVTTSIPPATTPESFNSIFTPHTVRQQQDNPWGNGNSAEGRPEDVIYTLHNTIENLENGARTAEDDGVRWEIIHESPSNNENVKHLDGAPRMKSLDEIVSQFRPFRTPPPPQPFLDPPEQQSKASDKKAVTTQKSSTRGKAKQKTFTTTITVTESTDAHGQTTYSASSSPIVRLPEPSDQQNTILAPSHRLRQKQPFLNRMHARQSAYMASSQLSSSPRGQVLPVRRVPSGARQERIKMFLISVKRQRKLKMKKHKYKKLMKRTRNLRRRLERN